MASSATSLFRVDGLVAVVTGGGTGIGRMIAQALAENGAKRVYIIGRRLEALQSAAEPYPAVITPIQCDITSKPSLQSAVDRVTSETGYVNLVVSNSGTYGPIPAYEGETVSDVRRRMFDEVDMDDFTRTFHVNVTGAFFAALAFLELLDEGNKRALLSGGEEEGTYYGKPLPTQGGQVPAVQSQVIFTASIGAYLRTSGAAPAYGGSKAAVVQMAKQAASMLAPFGIRTNVLAPGFFPSEMADVMIAHRKPEEEPVSDPDFIPARKFGSEKEMGGTVLYLASQAGSFCNGLVLAFDGGRLSVAQSSY